MGQARLFEPIDIGGVTLPNRVVVAPMCQYSADEGRMTDWHLIHLGQLALSRAGLAMVEATGVVPEGRITHGCTGLYDEACEAAMRPVVAAYRRLTRHPIGVQIGHAGRKASSQLPWKGRQWLKPDESPWQTVAPSAIPQGEGWHTPREMSVDDIRKLTAAFVSAAERAKRIGFDVVELHSAHGYLLHQFLSPLSNRRTDAYGKDRMKFPLEVAEAVRAVWPKDRALGARITASDWAEGGMTVEDCVAYARELERRGVDYVCVSSGALVTSARIPVTPGYQVPFAEKVKQALKRTKVRAVGMVVEPEHAERIVASGQADMIALARAMLDNPRWVWHAAERLGAKIDYPPQYERAGRAAWPGAAIARPA